MILGAVASARAWGVDFAKDVAPIFEAHCVRCHNAETHKGKFSLATREALLAGGEEGAAVVAGKSGESHLIELVSGEKPEMPAEGAGLSAEQVATLRRWVDEGATWPDGVTIKARARADKDWWSLRPLSDAKPPAVNGAPAGWDSAIDRFVYAKLAEKGLRPSGAASRRELIRRVTYDLTGLPPTPEEIEAFERDPLVGAYERVVDRLLASPRYGEQWGRHWLDVIRFGESSGFERNIIRDNAWPFRDYVIRSFNDNKPFDLFIIEHLAGDQIGGGDPAVEVGTGFLVAGPYDDVGNQDAKAAAQIRANTVDDIVSATGSAFLGLTLNCARCHDHKFDPIPQADYYRVQSALWGVQQGSRELATKAEREAAKAADPVKAELAGVEKELAALKGKPTTQPARVEELSAQRAKLQAQLASLPKVPTAWVGTFRQPAEKSYVMLGGDPQRHGPEVVPGSLAVLDRVTKPYELQADSPEGLRRLRLATWIVSEENPLTPRVLANRLWHYHFGTGIVDTPGDFGYMGGRPTHPELLDYLARRIKENGWLLKPVHREIVLSAAYRQSATWQAEAAGVDRDDRLLWRFPPRRLSAEELRDSMLAVAGVLDVEKASGPGFRLYAYHNDNVSTYVPLDHVGPETYRRAVFHQNARAATVDLLAEFDLPDCAFTSPRRSSTTTPLQALTLLNHSFTLDVAARFAERLARECGDDRAAAVRRAFVLAFGREASVEEVAAGERVIAGHGLATFCRAMLNANEMIYVY